MMTQKRGRILFTASAALALSLSALTAQAEGVSRGALLAAMCDTCHGTNGEGADPNPDIAGMDAADMVELMKAFAEGEEESTIMDRHAQGYTDEELQAMADYYAEL